MQKLSKKERHEAYKQALPNLKVWDYICIALQKPIEPFREFMLFTPDGWEKHTSFGRYKYNGNFQYNANKPEGKALRQTILMFCIEMTKPNGKKR